MIEVGSFSVGSSKTFANGSSFSELSSSGAISVCEESSFSEFASKSELNSVVSSEISSSFSSVEESKSSSEFFVVNLFAIKPATRNSTMISINPVAIAPAILIVEVSEVDCCFIELQIFSVPTAVKNGITAVNRRIDFCAVHFEVKHEIAATNKNSGIKILE